MKYHQVEIDDDVFEYVKQYAEPLVDNFNSALKKLLQINNPYQDSTNTEIDTPTYDDKQIPAGTPQALVQILKVAQIVLRGNTRNYATRIVSQEHDVTAQTVIDKYTRQLGITASKFDWLLAQPNQIELRSLLKRKFQNFQNVVDHILSSGT